MIHAPEFGVQNLLLLQEFTPLHSNTKLVSVSVSEGKLIFFLWQMAESQRQKDS
jgi:hypothetical protein